MAVGNKYCDFILLHGYFLKNHIEICSKRAAIDIKVVTLTSTWYFRQKPNKTGYKNI